MKSSIPLLLLAIILSGCAFSRSVSYHDLHVNTPSINDGKLSIAVWDQREQVTSGHRKPDFVGYTRSGAGIAYPMGTESGKPFADDIALDIATSFEQNGIKVNVVPTIYNESENAILSRLKDGDNDKYIYMKMNKLHTDGYMGFDLFYDLGTSVYKSSGELLIQKSITGTKPLGIVKHYKTNLPVGLQELLEQILNDPDIIGALNISGSKPKPPASNAVSQAEPTVEVSQAEPTVKVSQAEPTVEVSQAEPTVKVSQAEPTVEVSQAEPTVKVSQGSGYISTEFDVICLNNGSEIKSNVIEITNETIIYRYADQSDGPVRNVPIEDVFMIIYKNGSREIFKK